MRDDVEDAPCLECGVLVHLYNEPPCECGDVYCDFHACPVCSGELTVYNEVITNGKPTPLIQGSDEWHAIRRGMVTASVVGGLITAKALLPADNDTSRGITALLVAERITGITEPTYQSDDMLRGVMDEPVARDVYSGNYAEATTCGFMTRTWDGIGTLGFSPDGLVGDDGLIEIKCPRAKTHIRTVIDDEVPTPYMAQLQAGLLVSGRKWVDYVSFCGGLALYPKRVYPDLDWFNAICGALEAFEVTAAHMQDAYEAKAKSLPKTERSTYDLGLVF